MKKTFVNVVLALFIMANILNLSWGKDLYLTVRRDFSPQENPLVEMIYRNRAPITVRVLKPKDMKKFIAQQISKAFETNKNIRVEFIENAELRPGHSVFIIDTNSFGPGI